MHYIIIGWKAYVPDKDPVACSGVVIAIGKQE